MKNAIEAINELIKASNTAQARGAFSLKEAHDIYQAIEFINNAVQSQQAQQPQQSTKSGPEEPQEAI